MSTILSIRGVRIVLIAAFLVAVVLSSSCKIATLPATALSKMSSKAGILK